MAVDPHPKHSIERPTPDPKEIRRCLETLHGAGHTFEIRIPNPHKGPGGLTPRTVNAGYFDSPERAAATIARLTGTDAEAIYVTLNPVDPDLLSRCANRIKGQEKRDSLTPDDLVQRIMHFLIDVDPNRLTGISATETERLAALAQTAKIQGFLTDQLGWPVPRIDGCSGNGGALVYGLNLPNDAATRTLINGAMEALAHLFGSDVVTIDQTVTNPSRIGKVFGTVAAKGDHTPARPWRRATATYTPDASIVTVAQLAALAALAPAKPAPPSKPPATGTSGTRTWSITDKLDAQGIGYAVTTEPYATVYALDRCLTSTAHTDGAKILEMASGALAYKCHHNSCLGKRWEDARGALGLERDAVNPPPVLAPPAATVDYEPIPPTTNGHGPPPDPEPPPLRFQILTAEEMKHRPAQEWLVKGRVPRNTIGVIDGPPGTFKSFVALDLHLSTAARLEWLGQPIDRGPSLYIAAEGSAGLGARIRAWEAENGCEAPEDAYFLPEAVQLLQQQDNTDLLRAVARLSQMPVLIIIDTLSRSIAGFDENSSKDMSLLIEKADQLRRTTGAVVVFLHHTNKGAGTIRGSSAIPAGIDWQIELKRDGDLLTVTCEKQKDAEEFAPVHLVKKVYQLDEWQSSLVLVPTTSGTTQAARMAERAHTLLVETFGDLGATTTQWEEVCAGTAMPRAVFFRARKTLVEAGRVVADSQGRGARYRPAQVARNAEPVPLKVSNGTDTSVHVYTPEDVSDALIPSDTYTTETPKSGVTTPPEGISERLIPTDTEGARSEGISISPISKNRADTFATLETPDADISSPDAGLSTFIRTHCRQGAKMRLPLADLQRAYAGWCREQALRPMLVSDLLRALRARKLDIETGKTTGVSFVVGLSLAASCLAVDDGGVV